MSASLPELIRRRRMLKERIVELTAELDALDRMIFPRMAKMAEAWEGTAPASRPPPERPNGFRATSAPFYAAETGFQTKVAIAGLGGTSLSAVGLPSNLAYSAIVDAPAAKSVADAAYAVLEKAGGAVRTSILYRLLLESGIAVPGKQPINNLSAHLSNDARFVSTAQGWMLRSPSLWPQTQMFYSPTFDPEVPRPESE